MSPELPVVQVSLKDSIGGAAQRAREHLHGGPSREAVGTVVVSAVGAAIAMAAKATDVLTKEGSAKVAKLSTDVVKLEAGEAEAIQRLQVVLEASQQLVAGETPVPEELKGEKMAKKVAKVVKEGGKRGVEIEGAADMGGLQFFCTAVELPGANLKLLYESMRAMNAHCDPSEEERKGGSSAVGKLLCSATDESAVTVMTYVPKAKNEHIKADEWLLAVLKEAAPKAKLEFASSTHAGVRLKMGKEQGLFSIKVKDALIQGGISHLRSKGLFPDGDDDESDEMVFGDDFDVDAVDAVDQPFVAGETPVPEELKGDKMAKKLAKVVKEGGKRGVEIEGAADMGGLQFFCTAVELPGANLQLLYESMRAMNARCDSSEEERKGGSSAVGKLLCSATDESAVTVMTYVPKAKNEHIKADEWLVAVLKEAAPKAKLEFASSTHAGVTLKMGKEQGLFSIKVKDALIQGGISHLRSKGLFPDGDDDDDDEMIFGDDFDVDAC